MKKSIIDKIIMVILIISVTIQVGITIGYYMLINIDFDKYDNSYDVEVIR